MAPPGGFEPPTYRLTAGRSAIELQGIVSECDVYIKAGTKPQTELKELCYFTTPGKQVNKNQPILSYYFESRKQ